MSFQTILLLIIQFLLALFLGSASGCSRDPAAGGDKSGASSESHAESSAPSNRVEIPETVRRNLGITFSKVEARPVAQTIRVPGQFELQPEARREYRTMLAGRVELLVKQFDAVEPDQPLYRLSSTEWRELQEKLNEAESSMRQAEARTAAIGPLMAAHRKHEESLRTSVDLWEKRVEQLDQTRTSGVVTLDEYTAAQTTLAANRSGLAEVMEKEAELEGQRIETEAQLDAARSRIRLLLATASTVLGVDEEHLLKLCDPAPHDSGSHHHQGSASQPSPAWREIDVVEVRATRAGLVDRLELTNGSWATSGSLVLSTIEPDKLRFRAQGMQSDLGRLKDGLPALIVPPKSGSISLQDTMEGDLRIGLTADSQERTLDLLVVPQKMAAWARPGVSAHLEITAAGGQNEMAIPLSSVIQDGLAKIIFRRDPQNPDQAIRMEADLGIDDGRWVVINSGVREGDEVVLDGVYQLMIATSGSVEKGGHFHSDGTFHAGKDEK